MKMSKNLFFLTLLTSGTLWISSMCAMSEAEILQHKELVHKSLLKAVIDGHAHEVQQVIAGGGADINRVGPLQRTCLMWAAYYGYNDIVSLLLDAKADSNARDWRGHTPLMIAADGKYDQIVKILLDRGAFIDLVDNEGKPVFEGACEEIRNMIKAEHCKRVNLFIEERAAMHVVVNKDKWEQKEGSIDAVIEGTAYSESLQNRDTQSIKEKKLTDSCLVVTSNESKVKNDSFHIQLAGAMVRMVDDYVSSIQEVQKRVAQLDEEQVEQLNALLRAAVIRGDIEGVQRNLEDGAKVDVKDKDGKTLLSWAAGQGYTQVVRILLDHKAEVDGADVYGFTPLMDAVSRGHSEMARLLLELKADSNRANCFGETVLSLARQNDNQEIIDMLSYHY